MTAPTTTTSRNVLITFIEQKGAHGHKSAKITWKFNKH